MLQSRKFYYTIFVLGALYVLLVQQFFQNEGRFITQAPIYTEETPYAFNTNFQELNIPVNQELTLHGIWFKHENSKGLVLLFPDSDLDLRQLKINNNHYYSQGFDVLVTSYRVDAMGLGKLKHENDLFSDAQHWYNFAKSQFSEDKIVFVGNGFGGSIASQLAGNNPPRALILENPYYSFGDYQAKSRFWWLPYSYFTSFELNTWEYLRRTTSEIIFIQDETKKNQENSLTNFLKTSDKTYWLENNKPLTYSFQADKALFFEEILRPVLNSLESDQQPILKIK